MVRTRPLKRCDTRAVIVEGRISFNSEMYLSLKLLMSANAFSGQRSEAIISREGRKAVQGCGHVSRQQDQQARASR